MTKIIVFSEKETLFKELVSGAHAVGGDEVKIIGAAWGDRAELEKAGAQKVYHLGDSLDGICVDAAKDLLVELIREQSPKLVMFGATRAGKSLAAQVSAVLDLPEVSECASCAIDGEVVTTTKMVYGGLAVQTERYESATIVVAIPRGTFQSQPSSLVAEIVASPVSDSPVTVVERRMKETSSANVEEADAIVCVGRGFPVQADLAAAEELAEALGGVVGCSRPVAEDLHWLSEELYLGMTGKVVRPKLLVVAGCSGQVQLMTGVRDSGTIVGINSDPKATLWNYCDYGIVGDVREVIPLFVSELESALS